MEQDTHLKDSDTNPIIDKKVEERKSEPDQDAEGEDDEFMFDDGMQSKQDKDLPPKDDVMKILPKEDKKVPPKEDIKALAKEENKVHPNKVAKPIVPKKTPAEQEAFDYINQDLMDMVDVYAQLKVIDAHEFEQYGEEWNEYMKRLRMMFGRLFIKF